ncbi:MAG: sigma-70 family RNA polymerase sigma factor [Planctomycetes bacterium]|nr:sigma-70 family RNA polymerase sigma factor [Planctomycetota bacterium]
MAASQAANGESRLEEPFVSEVTQILQAIEDGDAHASEDLLPLVYGELRKLAAHRMSSESPGHTMQATALVHEAYLRLVGKDGEAPSWASRAVFFAAAAESMRRILIDQARAKRAVKRGGGHVRREFRDTLTVEAGESEQILALNEALTKLKAVDEMAANLVELRFFAGLTGKEAAAMLGVSPRKADQIWAFARAWLRAETGE